MKKFTLYAIKKVIRELRKTLSQFITKAILWLYGIKYGEGFISFGVPYISLARNAKFTIGQNCKLNNGNHFNVIGRQQKCIFKVSGELTFGNNVGLSSTAIVCLEKVAIGDFVKIGGNTVIYDTDFHSLDPSIRSDFENDKASRKSAPVIIEKNAFIGAHSTILKGVTIGENSIVGACSLVSRSIPANEIWGGNPAKFIKKI